MIGINCITVAAASGISFAIPSDVAKDFLVNAKRRVKDLKHSTGVSPFKLKARDRFYIGEFVLSYPLFSIFVSCMGNLTAVLRSLMVLSGPMRHYYDSCQVEIYHL